MRRTGSLAAVVGAGAVAGACAKWVDETGPLWLAMILSGFAGWVLALGLLARWSPSPRAAALRSAAFFVALCAGYFAVSRTAYGFAEPLVVGIWLALALTVVPVLGASTRSGLERAGWRGALLTALLPTLALGEALTHSPWGSGSPSPVLVTVGAAVAVVLLAVLPAASVRVRAVLCLPLWAAAAAGGVLVLRHLLGGVALAYLRGYGLA